MATTFAKGFGTKLGFKVATTWGTPVLVGSGNQKEYKSEKLTPNAEFIADEGLSGKSTRLPGDKGNEFHSGSVVFDVRYEGLEDLIGMALGDANGGSSPSQVGSDNAYKHIFKPADDKEGKFGTLVLAKQVAVWEYTTAKIGGFTFKAANGKRLELTVPFIPQGLNINTASGTNKTSTVANLSLPTNRNFALFSQMKVRIHDSSGGALADADLIYVSDFECALDNKFPTNDVTSKYGYLIDEPIQDGFSTVTGSIKFTKYNDSSPGGNDALIANLLDKTPKQMTVTFTGPAIGATAFSLTFYFPAVQFSGGDANVGGPGRVPVNLNFEAARYGSTPTGFPSGYTDGLTIELVNQRATNALA